MGENKRQHYVPQFYLKNFSDSKKFINTYNISRSKYIPEASIRDMCQKENFYGADKKLEHFLNRVIETDTSTIIKDIINTNTFPNKEREEYIQLIVFLLVTEARNLKAADSTNNMFDIMSKNMLSLYPDIKKSDLDSFKIKLEQPSHHNIKIAIESAPLVYDLEPLLIVEPTGARKFITSDNPVVRYNSFYLEKNYFAGFGHVTRGLQLFFPISPQKCILLYDKHAYDIKGEKNGVLNLKAREVDQLNDLFYLNAYNNVFFNQKTKKEYIEGIHYKNKNIPKISELEREVSLFKSVNSHGSLFHFSQNKVSKKINFSWMKTSDFAKSLTMPAHLGGVHRTESLVIRRFIEERNANFGNGPSSPEKFIRVNK
ncbi:DUF4238 domain-containing protein [Bacillaceae bacterium CLA-AA-H227]|uniref:DUF4238 domain-containing protein n=1 Tax=Robertmurraya yapensis (ex Hitch et al 2024) TaxID=3133160 RepID=A0ACC6SGP7_9BACI